jgi:PII-like signaling protein
MEHERLEGDRTLMRIHVGESHKWHGKPLYQAIVELLRHEGLYGATVLRGVGGYGSSSQYHEEKLLHLSQDLPVVIEVVEYSERVEGILPQLDEMIDGGLITLEKAHVVLYRVKDGKSKGA